MSFDVDDVGAVCAAHALMDKGEADLLAVITSTGYPEAIGAASVLSEWYRHSDAVRLGAYKAGYGRTFGVDARGEWIKGGYGATENGAYVPHLARNWPSPVKHAGQVPDAVDVYRDVLSRAEDRSVAIAVVGFAINIANLLQSKADRHSPLRGVDLVARKVKLVVWQGGWYAPLHEDGHQTFNWDCGDCCGYDTRRDACQSRARDALALMPASVEQIFSDIGDEIYHGGALLWCQPEASPCRAAYTIHPWGINERGRSSWDPICVLVAVRGAAAANCSRVDRGGTNRADAYGANYWTPPANNGSALNLRHPDTNSLRDENDYLLSNQSVLALNGHAPWRDERRDASNALEKLLCQYRE